MPVAAGSVLAHFRIERELGRGGMGLVFIATDLRLGRQVALKVIRPEAADATGREAALQQLEREAQLAAAVSHPNLVTIFTFERQGDQALVAMELLEGQTLSERLKAGWRPTVTEAGWILGEIASGVAAAHAAGIVHLDLKPGNVMQLVDGRVKVLDFGIARTTRQRGERRTVSQGTPAYMSPEQLRGGPYTPAADVWAIGAIGVHLLTGTRPYDGTDPHLVAQAVLSGPPPALRGEIAGGLGPLEDPLRQCFAPLDQRLPDAGALLAALRAPAARRASASPARPSAATRVARAAPGSPPSQWFLPMVLLAALLLLGGSAYLLFEPPGPVRSAGIGGTDWLNPPTHDTAPPAQDTIAGTWEMAMVQVVARGPGDSGEAFLRGVLATLETAEDIHRRQFGALAGEVKAVLDWTRRRGELPMAIDPEAGVRLSIRVDQAPDGGYVARAEDDDGWVCTLRAPPGAPSEVTCEWAPPAGSGLPPDSGAGLGLGGMGPEPDSQVVP